MSTVLQHLDPTHTAVLLILVVTALSTLIASRVGDSTIAHRPLPWVERLRPLAQRAGETGSWLHFSVGATPLGRRGTLATLAGLATIQAATEATSARGVPTRLTTGDPVTFAIARSTLAMPVELVAVDRLAYAAAAASLIADNPPLANVMIGSLHEEFLLPGEAARANGVEQVAGSASLAGIALTTLLADRPAIGEEVLAGALASDPTHATGLRSIDWIRAALISGIVAFSIGRLAGWL